jgi:hypothetical protein
LWYVFYRDDSIIDGKTMELFSSQKSSQKVPEALVPHKAGINYVSNGCTYQVKPVSG